MPAYYVVNHFLSQHIVAKGSIVMHSVYMLGDEIIQIFFNRNRNKVRNGALAHLPQINEKLILVLLERDGKTPPHSPRIVRLVRDRRKPTTKARVMFHDSHQERNDNITARHIERTGHGGDAPKRIDMNIDSGFNHDTHPESKMTVWSIYVYGAGTMNRI